MRALLEERTAERDRLLADRERAPAQVDAEAIASAIASPVVEALARLTERVEAVERRAAQPAPAPAADHTALVAQLIREQGELTRTLLARPDSSPSPLELAQLINDARDSALDDVAERMSEERTHTLTSLVGQLAPLLIKRGKAEGDA